MNPDALGDATRAVTYETEKQPPSDQSEQRVEKGRVAKAVQRREQHRGAAEPSHLFGRNVDIGTDEVHGSVHHGNKDDGKRAVAHMSDAGLQSTAEPGLLDETHHKTGKGALQHHGGDQRRRQLDARAHDADFESEQHQHHERHAGNADDGAEHEPAGKAPARASRAITPGGAGVDAEAREQGPQAEQRVELQKTHHHLIERHVAKPQRLEAEEHRIGGQRREDQGREGVDQERCENHGFSLDDGLPCTVHRRRDAVPGFRNGI